MKAHIGVNSEMGIVHSMSTTAANVHDVTQTHNLLHGSETVVWGDAGYQGVHKREENLGLEMNGDSYRLRHSRQNAASQVAGDPDEE